MSRKLLLADDSITIQKVIGITFVNEDFDLSVVDNGDAALEKARAERPDLILADVFMPGKNGYELCAAVKSDPALAGVPVLLLTGTFEPFDEGKANSAGADGWIAKPFESQTLISRVRELLDRAPAALATPVEPPAMVEPEIEEVAPEIEEVELHGTAEPAPDVAPEADLWEDFDEVAPAVAASPVAEAPEEVPGSADFGDIFGPEEEAPSAETTADDIWGDVSFEDEDLAAEPAAVMGSELEDIWAPQEEMVSEPSPPAIEEDSFDFAVEPEAAVELEIEAPPAVEPVSDDLFVFEEESAVEGVAAADISVEDELSAFEEEPLVEVPKAVESVEEELMELGDEDILLLDEAEILAEEELAAEPVAAGMDDDFLFVEDEEETVLEESSLTDEDLFGDIAAPFEAEPVVPEPEPVFAEPELPMVAASAGAVESRVQALSDEDLEAIVEKVAGAVIERLAGTILEKIAWEVVPDLAETLIKEEIRQIKETVR
ncbi:response regulator [Trichloromonas sp.]|uniref:response regulator transcription factor n=1 Tax=Trichloromonas sp. TaxID=3069249 RepID=UPI003D8188EC